MRVLIVEPDTVLRRQLAKLFSAADHTVFEAETIAQAVAYLDEKGADVIVLEPHIPVHNGIEFLYELRSYVDWQSIPVIIYSYASDKLFCSEEQRKQLGIATFLCKTKSRLQDVRQAVESSVVTL